MGSVSGNLRTRIYDFFGDQVSAITPIREMVDMNKQDMDDDIIGYIRSAAHDYDLARPDEATDDAIRQSFKHASDGWDTRIREQLAQFVVWARKMAIEMGEKEDAPGIAIPYLLKRAERYVEKGPNANVKTDRLLEKMDRAGLAAWEWFGNLEKDGVAYMGELVSMKEEDAFSDKYFPVEYSDVKDITCYTIKLMMKKNGVCFDYWKRGDSARYQNLPKIL